jgi:hypothetical protein
MKFDPPLLTTGPLSGKVYVVTHGKHLDGGVVQASVKYDVTDQFEALAASRERQADENV